MGSQEVRALLVARKQLLGRLIDVELIIQGFEPRIRELVMGQATLERIAALLTP